MRKSLPLILLALTAGACQTTGAPPPAAAAANTPPAPAVGAAASAQPVEATRPSQVSFEEWLAGLRSDALARGISPGTFDRATAGIRPNQQVLSLDQSQPEFTRPIWEYLATAVSEQRVANGRRKLSENAGLLRDVEARYGVPGPIIVAIWGAESGYGTNMGSFDVVEALATLAWSSPRGASFRAQLLDALAILDAGEGSAGRLYGSWAGAMGQTQFMPASFRTFAVDHDGDGRRDIWNSLPDVFGSTGNYLARSGWTPGEPWLEEVRLPPSFDWTAADPAVHRTVAEWAQLGVQPMGGTFRAGPQTEGSVLLPTGHRGPAFLAYRNFNTILRYNNSTSYGMAIGLLADRIAGRPGVTASWPTDEIPLSRTERIELQSLLSLRGFDPGAPDGIVGPNTRAAVRGYQLSIGVPADGHPTVALLSRLRAQRGA